MGARAKLAQEDPLTNFDLFRHATNVESHAAGTTIFRKGDPASQMFVLREGEVEILVNGKLVDSLRPGTIFGEMAIIASSPRGGDAVAKTDVKLVPVDRDAFLRMVQQTPFFAIQVMQLLVERIARNLPH
jgi:CRP-like cAMP-binding protein